MEIKFFYSSIIIKNIISTLANIVSEIKRAEENIRKNENEIRQLIQTISKLEAKKESALSLKDKISSVDICPECGQKVTEQHKKEIDKLKLELEEDEIIEETKEVMVITQNGFLKMLLRYAKLSKNYETGVKNG